MCEFTNIHQSERWIIYSERESCYPVVSDVSVLQYYCNNEAIFVPLSPYETEILKGFQPTGSAFLNLPWLTFSITPSFARLLRRL